jgi:DNA-binding beta-propeller fold protein YncE
VIAVCLALAVWATPPAAADSLSHARQDSLPPARQDSLRPARQDTLPHARRDSLQPARQDSLQPARQDSLPLTLSRAGGIERLSTDPSRPVEPAGFAFDPFGRVVVSDATLRRLVRYEADGRPIDETGALGNDADELRRPTAVATAGVLQIAVLDEEKRSVAAYDLYGHFQSTAIDLDNVLESRGESRARPVALASDRGGGLYVGDGDGDRVLVFDAAGRLVRQLKGNGSGGASLHGVAGVAVAKRGDVFVSERVTGRIVRLDPTGARRTAWTLPDSTAAQRLPLAVDDSMRVACADPTRASVWVFDASGRPLAEIGGLEGVSALAFARDGSLWAAERTGRRLTRLVLAPRARPERR